MAFKIVKLLPLTILSVQSMFMAVTAMEGGTTILTSHPGPAPRLSNNLAMGSSAENHHGGAHQMSLGSLDSFLGRNPREPATRVFTHGHGAEHGGLGNKARLFYPFGSFADAWNTSVAFTVPLFAFTFPDFSASRFSLADSLGINRLFSFMEGRAMGGVSQFSDTWMETLEGLIHSDVTRSVGEAVETAVAKLASTIGDQCSKRFVCEAHRQDTLEEKVRSDIHGNEHDQENSVQESPLLETIRALIPLPHGENGKHLEEMTLSPYQVAALYGRSQDSDCGEQYQLCFLSLLDSTTSLSEYMIKVLDTLSH